VSGERRKLFEFQHTETVGMARPPWSHLHPASQRILYLVNGAASLPHILSDRLGGPPASHGVRSVVELTQIANLPVAASLVRSPQHSALSQYRLRQMPLYISSWFPCALRLGLDHLCNLAHPHSRASLPQPAQRTCGLALLPIFVTFVRASTVIHTT
jgi:hypothetical protein